MQMTHLQLEIRRHLGNVRGIARVIKLQDSPGLINAVLQIWTQSSYFLSSYSPTTTSCDCCAMSKVKWQERNENLRTGSYLAFPLKFLVPMWIVFLLKLNNLKLSSMSYKAHSWSSQGKSVSINGWHCFHSYGLWQRKMEHYWATKYWTPSWMCYSDRTKERLYMKAHYHWLHCLLQWRHHAVWVDDHNNLHPSSAKIVIVVFVAWTRYYPSN